MTLMTFLKRAALTAAATLSLSGPLNTAMAGEAAKPTIVLVHGAFADSSSWNGIVPGLEHAGYPVISAATPLRSLSGDAASVAALVRSIKGPVVLVGHSYGGSVITNAAAETSNVKALVYIAALAPDAGESAFDLVGKFPGSTLGAALAPPVTLPDGTHDLRVLPDRFAGPLAADLPPATVALLAAAQRPVTDAALKGASGTPAWKTIPAWFLYGSADKSIPAETHRFMAARANARKTVVVPGASHLVMISHPGAVKRLIEDAARASTP